MQRLIRATLWVMVLVSQLLLVPNASFGTSPDQVWEQFRSTFPLHYQTVAVTSPTDGAVRTVIISEPPPHATIEGLKECGPKLIQAVNIKKHEIGHDGWVKDVVLTLNPAPDAAVEDFVTQLNAYLFRSIYAMKVLPLPATRSEFKDPTTLDLKVSVSELRRWLLEDEVEFQSLAGGKPVKMRDIFASRLNSVFISPSGGLVLFTFPKNADLTAYRCAIRQFAQVSDLLIGAVGNDDQLALIGRKRVVPIDVLPPLRTETLVQLSSVNTNSLAQSYERNRVLAGPLGNTWDWAPILLSPELVNSEYGSLLNITDQFLKSWSSNGQVEYEHFQYPEPGKWPFKKPLILEIGTNELTFNWNTAGAGYVVASDGFTWFALNRSGALPVSYIPAEADASQRQATAKYEEIAYDYFSGLDNPYLARVVSYAGAYQIFRYFRPTAEKSTPETPAQAKGKEVLSKYTVTALNALGDASPQKMFDVSSTMSKSSAEDNLAANLTIYTTIYSLQKGIKEYRSAVGEKGLHELADMIANPRQTNPEETEKVVALLRKKLADEGEDISVSKILAVLPDQQSKKIAISFLFSNSMCRLILNEFVDIGQTTTEYAKAFSKENDEWIHTPSIVISRAKGEITGAIGGHNLDAKIPRFEPGQVEPGRVHVRDIDGQLVVEFNPADASRVAAIVRKTGTMDTIPGRKPKDLADELNKELALVKKRSPRPESEALFEGRSPPSIENSTWHNLRSTLTESDKTTSGTLLPKTGPGLHIKRIDGKHYEVIRMDDADTFDKFAFDSQIAVLEFIGTARAAAPDQSRALHLALSGFSQPEADGLLSTLEFRSGMEKRPSYFARTLLLRDGESVGERATLYSQFDFEKATINEATISEGSADSKGFKEVSLDVEIPSRIQGKASLWFRIRVFFSESVANAKDLVLSMARSLVGRNYASISEFDAAVAAFQTDAKKYGVRVQGEFYGGKPNQKMLLDMLEVRSEVKRLKLGFTLDDKTV
jgi:hypothetical protein